MTREAVDAKWHELTLGLHLTHPGTAKNTHTGSWRSSRPIWDASRCVRCGVCDMYCPEGCVKPDAEGKYGANLDYCKGCGICARECVTGAIHMVTEEH